MRKHELVRLSTFALHSISQQQQQKSHKKALQCPNTALVIKPSQPTSWRDLSYTSARSFSSAHGHIGSSSFEQHKLYFGTLAAFDQILPTNRRPRERSEPPGTETLPSFVGASHAINASIASTTECTGRTMAACLLLV